MKEFSIAVENFINAYGTSFLVMVAYGFIIAFIAELGIKKAFEWLEEKLGKKDYLAIAKMVVIFLFTIVGSYIATKLLMKSDLPLPGNSVMALIWYFVIYVSQFVFSMFGIKNILHVKDNPKTEKIPKKKKASPVAGMQKIAHNVYRDANDNLYRKNGEPL